MVADQRYLQLTSPLGILSLCRFCRRYLANNLLGRCAACEQHAHVAAQAASLLPTKKADR